MFRKYFTVVFKKTDVTIPDVICCYGKTCYQLCQVYQQLLSGQTNGRFMKLLLILFTAFFTALLGTKLVYGVWDFLFAGNLGMAVFIIFTGLSHFRFQKGMVMMIPEFIPAKLFFVYLTGVLEIAAGVGLMIPSLRATTAILLIIFFIVVFIANVNSSKKMINIFKADYTGPGMNYLYAQRLPMQLILIAWTWYFGLYLK